MDALFTFQFLDSLSSSEAEENCVCREGSSILTPVVLKRRLCLIPALQRPHFVRRKTTEDGGAKKKKKKKKKKKSRSKHSVVRPLALAQIALNSLINAHSDHIRMVCTSKAALQLRHTIVDGKKAPPAVAFEQPRLAECLTQFMSEQLNKRAHWIFTRRPVSPQQLFQSCVRQPSSSLLPVTRQATASSVGRHAVDVCMVQRDLTNMFSICSSCNGQFETNHSGGGHKAGGTYCGPLPVVNSSAARAQELKIFKHTFVIPPRSVFFLGDLLQTHSPTICPPLDYLLCCDDHVGGKFDFVVVDPPWPSKSVSRRKNYKTLPAKRPREHGGCRQYPTAASENVQSDSDVSSWHALLSLPVSSMCAPGALVVVWITNNPAIRKFVVQQLMPAWRCVVVGTWWWLKLTVNGEPIVPTPTHNGCRSPYEPFIVGRRMSEEQSASSHAAMRFPIHRIVCAPVTFHSEKPNLAPALMPWLIDSQVRTKCASESTSRVQSSPTAPEAPDTSQHVCCGSSSGDPCWRPRFLELFARRLRRGWCSAGDEVLKFQQREFFAEHHRTSGSAKH